MELTAIVLNWMRPLNVQRICVEYATLSVPCIVWNNSVVDFVPLDGTKFPKIINAGENYGVIARYSAALLGQTDCIVIQDDDLLVPIHAISYLYSKWKVARNSVHGLFGRIPNSKNEYADLRDHEDERVEIVCGRIMMFHRMLLPVFFIYWFDDRIKAIRNLAKEKGLATHADDILLSYLAMSLSGEKNYVWDLARVELPDAYAIHRQEGHLEIRQAMMRVCQQIFKYE